MRPRFRDPTGGVLALLLTAAVAGTAANTFGPRRLPWVQNWSGDLARRARARGIALIGADALARGASTGALVVFDARSPAEYRAGRVPGAVSLPQRRVEQELPAVEPLLTPEQRVAVYCFGLDCDEGLLLADYLKRYGYTNVCLYAGGFHTWRREGRPVERSRPEDAP